MKRLFVGNLPFRSTEEELESWFGETGFRPDQVIIMRDRVSGESRGFGFANFQDDREGDSAVEQLNGRPFQGRKLIINEARPMTEKVGGGRQGGGYREAR